MPQAKVNFNVNATPEEAKTIVANAAAPLIKWASQTLVIRRISRRFQKDSPSPDDERKQKVIQMAIECSARLRFRDWDLMFWPPKSVSPGIVDIFASSPKSKDPNWLTEIAWELSGADYYDGNVVDAFVAKQMLLQGYENFFKLEDKVDAVGFLHSYLSSLLHGQCDEFKIYLIQKCKSQTRRHPLWSFLDKVDYPFKVWSVHILEYYFMFWEENVSSLLDVKISRVRRQQMRSKSTKSNKYFLANAWIKHFIDILDVLTTSQVAKELGYICKVSTNYATTDVGWGSLDGPEEKTFTLIRKLTDPELEGQTSEAKEFDSLFATSWLKQEDETVDSEAETSHSPSKTNARWKVGAHNYRVAAFIGLQVSFTILSSVVLQEFVLYIKHLLHQKRKVGKKTNLESLREKHLYSNWKHDSTGDVFKKFIQEWLPNVEAGGENISDYETATGWVPEISTDVDPSDAETVAKIWSAEIFGIMNEVLCGDVVKCDSIQWNIARDLLKFSDSLDPHVLGDSEIERNLSKRKVRYLRLGNDCAMTIPYLNKMIILLDPEKWIRDFDVTAEQPLQGRYNEGPVRRVANVLLALEYQIKENNVIARVNDTAFDILKKYARKGELHSKELRDKLISCLRVENRVSVRALTETGKEIFGKDRLSLSALVREMIHDRVTLNGKFDKELVPDEVDAYYDALYLQTGYKYVRNNIKWDMGAPIFGVAVTSLGRRKTLGAGFVGKSNLRNKFRDNTKKNGIKIRLETRSVASIEVCEAFEILTLRGLCMYLKEVEVR